MQFWIQIEKQNKFQAILSHESSGVGCSLQLKTIKINAKNGFHETHKYFFLDAKYKKQTLKVMLLS